jgi:hypothetical protein
MIGDELRQRIVKLGLTYTDAAPLLGLSGRGLHHQMRGERPVTKQTEMLLERIELIVELTRDMSPEEKCGVVERAMRKFEHRELARQTLGRRK